MSDFIGIDIAGEKELIAKLKKLPPAVADTGVEAANEYIINTQRRYPSYKKVTRKSAYGVTFFTERQRRWFFAALGDGSLKLPYKRTQGYSKGWKTVGQGYRQIAVNESPYGEHLQGERQSRLSAKIGWKKITEWLKENMPRIVEKFDGGVKKAIRKLGLD